MASTPVVAAILRHVRRTWVILGLLGSYHAGRRCPGRTPVSSSDVVSWTPALADVGVLAPIGERFAGTHTIAVLGYKCGPGHVRFRIVIGDPWVKWASPVGSGSLPH